MPDEDVIGRGGSLILTCWGGKKELNKKAGPKGEYEFHHPSKGKIYSVEVTNDGTGKALPPIPVTGSPETEIVIHYRV
jgi:hypothetical protein